MHRILSCMQFISLSLKETHIKNQLRCSNVQQHLQFIRLSESSIMCFIRYTFNHGLACHWFDTSLSEVYATAFYTNLRYARCAVGHINVRYQDMSDRYLIDHVALLLGDSRLILLIMCIKLRKTKISLCLCIIFYPAGPATVWRKFGRR